MCYTIHPTEDDREYFAAHPVTDPKARVRVLAERLFVREAVKRLIAKGYGLQLFAMSGPPLSALTRQWKELMKHLMTDGGDEFIDVFSLRGEPTLVGIITLASDGHYVDCAPGTWLFQELGDVNALADRLENTYVVEGS